MTINNIHPSLMNLAVELSTLTEDPRNARRHNAANIALTAKSFEEHGQLKPIVVQRLPDGTLVVRAGNGSCAAVRSLGWTQIAAVVVDSTDREAIAFALRDNRSAELAEWDTDVLGELLLELRDEQSMLLDDVGFTDRFLDSLVAGTQELDPNAEWNGMPEFDQPDASAARQITVNFKNDADVKAFGEAIGQPMTGKTRSIWFPKVEIDHLMDKRYKAKKK